MLTKQDFTVLRVLLVCIALATIPVLLGGFMATMLMLWVFCGVFWIIFQGAIWEWWGAQSLLLTWLVRMGAKSGKTSHEVYRRGRNVTAFLTFLIPVLLGMAK